MELTYLDAYYPKYVLTTDFLIQKRNGINHANIAEFIKNNLNFN